MISVPYIKTTYINATNKLVFAFAKSGGRQPVLLFGTANGTTVLGLITIGANGDAASWYGVNNEIITGINVSGYQVTVTFSKNVYDTFTLISPVAIA